VSRCRVAAACAVTAGFRRPASVTPTPSRSRRTRFWAARCPRVNLGHHPRRDSARLRSPRPGIGLADDIEPQARCADASAMRPRRESTAAQNRA
jgi:hypothetical protein